MCEGCGCCSSKETNSEGMTFKEWLTAANLGRDIPIDKEIAKKEWRLGVDPCEQHDPIK